MLNVDRWYLPDGETHLTDWMTQVARRVPGHDGVPRLTYQYHKYEAALAHTACRRVAVDVGAHVGLWSYWLVRDFDRLWAFEPCAAYQPIWWTNVGRAAHAVGHQADLIGVGLGAARGPAVMWTTPGSSGDTRVVASGPSTAYTSTVDLHRLDDYDLPCVDLLKIDCEGYEVFVLEGGLETLTRCHPTVIVEQKAGHGQRYGRGEREAVDLLERLGARVRWEQGGDYVCCFPDTEPAVEEASTADRQVASEGVTLPGSV